MVVSICYVYIFFFKQKTAYEMLRSLVGSEMCIRDRYKESYRSLVQSAERTANCIDKYLKALGE